VDSGAGQSICSSSDAFFTLRPCAILVVGVAGSMPVHGMGTARFTARVGGKDVILNIHNCLFCHGEAFNLLSVSQMLRFTTSSIIFKEGASKIYLKQRESDLILSINLKEEEGLYQLQLRPFSVNDTRNAFLPIYDVTSENDPKLFDEVPTNLMGRKAPSSLGQWTRKVLWMGMKAMETAEYDANLKDFCKSYFVPTSQSLVARRTYQVDKVDDMADLSIRFMGVGNDRLIETLKRSRGLTPCKRGETVTTVPSHNFPQGKWARGKTPKVAKGKVKFKKTEGLELGAVDKLLVGIL
jgi:hypothetical protein